MDRLSDISVFVQVVDSGSFTAAAERLGLSKSVVSKYVTRLEDRLGARLLNRTTRRLSLTEAGEMFYNRSLRGLEQIAEAESEVSRLQSTPRGTLRLNTPMTFGILHVAPALPAFMARYPDLKVDMNLDDRQLDPVEGGFDLAIRIAELPDSSMVARRLAPCRRVVCATPDYLEHHGTPRNPDELRSHNALTFHYHDSPSQWCFLATDGTSINVSVNGDLHMNNSLALREALLQGMGIALAPTFLVGADIQAGRLQTVLDNYRAPERSIYFLYPQRRHLSPKVRAFIEFMSERITQMPDWDG
jgi:DNA-binding transcriptional LysR family regulator